MGCADLLPNGAHASIGRACVALTRTRAPVHAGKRGRKCSRVAWEKECVGPRAQLPLLLMLVLVLLLLLAGWSALVRKKKPTPVQ